MIECFILLTKIFLSLHIIKSSYSEFYRTLFDYFFKMLYLFFDLVCCEVHLGLNGWQIQKFQVCLLVFLFQAVQVEVVSHQSRHFICVDDQRDVGSLRLGIVGSKNSFFFHFFIHFLFAWKGCLPTKNSNRPAGVKLAAWNQSGLKHSSKK